MGAWQHDFEQRRGHGGRAHLCLWAGTGVARVPLAVPHEQRLSPRVAADQARNAVCHKLLHGSAGVCCAARARRARHLLCHGGDGCAAGDRVSAMVRGCEPRLSVLLQLCGAARHGRGADGGDAGGVRHFEFRGLRRLFCRLTPHEDIRLRHAAAHGRLGRYCLPVLTVVGVHQRARTAHGTRVN